MGQTAYSSAVLADAPWTFYKLDEASGLPQDSSGNGRHIGTIDGSYTYRQAGPVAGTFGMLSADSSQLNGANAAPNAVNNMSLEAWIKAGSAFGANNSALFNVGPAGTGFELWVDTTLTFQVNVKAGPVAQLNSTAVLSTAVYRHVVIVRDATVWKYYVDGALDTANAGTTAPTDPSAGGLQLIQDLAATYSSVWSNAAYYTTALSAARVAAHYAAMQAVDVPVGALGSDVDTAWFYS